MARPKNSVPTYTHHKPTGQAYIRIRDDSGNRKIVYLGAFNSPESRDAYAREIAKLGQPRAAAPAPGSPPLSVNEVLLAFLQHAIQHYRRPDGSATRELGEFKQAAGFLRRLFGETPAEEFGPRKLKDVREQFLAAGWCRKVINLRINRVRHVFKWAAGEELVPGAVWQDLRAVEGLQIGRTIAPERPPVGPVDEATVKRVLPYLRPMVRAMVEVQLLTGMRPGEVISLRPVELDTAATVWVYKPSYHKLTYRAKARAVAIGPQAQKILRRFTPADPADFYFSPRRSVAEFHAERSAARRTPRYASHEKPRMKKPERSPQVRYTSASYGRAITKAIERANRILMEAGVEVEQHIPHFHPNQLRHSHATEVRRRFGLEAAQASLGHDRASTTEIYAEKNLGLATMVAESIG